MSLYECQDRVEEHLKSLDLANPSIEVKALQHLLTLLQHAESHFHLQVLKDLHAHVCLQIQNTSNKRLVELYNYIKGDISQSILLKQSVPYNASSTPLQKLHAYMHKRRLRFTIRQGLLPELGNSSGECYGFTLSMADSTLNPYATNKPIQFNRTIHHYQKRQSERKKDQLVIKRQRLTGRKFCPSPKQRALELMQLANKHIDKDLCVSLHSPGAAHATYVRLQADGKVRYMDPNLGAYLFENQAEFISAYQLSWLYQREKHNDNHYLSYTVDELQEDRTLTRREQKTWQGKLRTLLTGSKYQYSGNKLVDIFSPIFASILFQGMIAAIGAVLGTVLFPGIGSVGGAVAGAYLASFLLLIGATQGYQGFLSPLLGIASLAYRVSDHLQKTFGLKREWDNTPTFDHTTLSSIQAPSAQKKQVEASAKAKTKNPSANEPYCFASPLNDASVSQTEPMATSTQQLSPKS